MDVPVTLDNRLFEALDCECEWLIPDCAETDEMAESMDEDRGIALPEFAFVEDINGEG